MSSKERFTLSHDDAHTALIALDTAIESIVAAADSDESIAEECARYEALAIKLARRFRARGWSGGAIDRYGGKA